MAFLFSRWRVILAVAPLMLLLGCAGRPLMPTPDIYAEGHRQPFENLAPELENNKVDLLYATDRVLEEDEAGNRRYGYGRSPTLVVGNALVEIGESLDWDALRSDSQRRDRVNNLQLKLREINKLGSFPETPYRLERTSDGALRVHAETQATRDWAIRALRDEVLRRFALTPRKDVFIYVHGYNNDFKDAAFTLVDIWHFLGREGVPLLYTWPAGHGGIRGYGYDRESGEYTIFHFKELMRALAEVPEIEGVHILAHSRGTDVTVSTLRELFIEALSAGIDPIERFRIRNLILAAPDLDIEVISQRIIGEQFFKGIENFTIYTAIGDKAISVAEGLFASNRRLGRVVWSDVPEDYRALVTERLTTVGRVDFVQHKGKTAFFGHGYFHDNPSASSDLISIMRYGEQAGSQARPLKVQGPHFWLLEDGYLSNADQGGLQ